jgi:hypothetical protein
MDVPAIEGATRMSREHGRYISYLLRLWQTRSEGKLIWRASLESPHTGERRGFTNLGDLFAFLEKEVSHAEQGADRVGRGRERGDAHRRQLVDESHDGPK